MSFLQALGIVLACVFGLSFPLSETACSLDVPGMTRRQREIMLEVNNYASPWPDVKSSGWLLSSWDVSRGLPELVEMPTGDDNAASCFFRLEELYPGESESLKSDGGGSRGVDELLRAADMGRCRLTPETYPEFDSTTVRQPNLSVYGEYLEALLRRAEGHVREGRMQEAGRCYRAAMICGWHLLSDKSNCLVYATGLMFSVKGAQGYSQFLAKSENRSGAASAGNYARTMAEVLRAFTWKANVALSEVDGFGCLPAAIHIALSDNEAFWRKEAVIRLATLRYGIAWEKEGYVERNPRFEQAADDALSAVVRLDPDASVRRLAIWSALNVSPGNYAGLEHRFQQ